MIVAEPRDAIAAWVAAMQGLPASDWGNYNALALVKDGQIVGGVIYNNWNGAGVCAHIAGAGRRWLNRAFLHAMFDYPFNQCARRRITALVARRNKHARRFVENLGFRYEGCVRHALPADDWMLYGMLREECRFLAQEPIRRAA